MSVSGAASDYLESLIMKWLGRNTSMPPPPGTLYLALFIGGVPGDDTSGATEVSAGNYSRLAVTTGSSGTGTGSVFNFPSGTAGQLVNPGNVDFPSCNVANWGTITGWALFDDLTAGNMLVRGDVSPSQTINVGDIFRFNAGGWTITIG